MSVKYCIQQYLLVDHRRTRAPKRCGPLGCDIAVITIAYHRIHVKCVTDLLFFCFVFFFAICRCGVPGIRTNAPILLKNGACSGGAYPCSYAHAYIHPVALGGGISCDTVIHHSPMDHHASGCMSSIDLLADIIGNVPFKLVYFHSINYYYVSI